MKNKTYLNGILSSVSLKLCMLLKKSNFILIGLATTGLLLTQCGGNSAKEKAGSIQVEVNTSEESAQQPIGVGQVLNTNYFDVTVNKVSVKTKVNTGNQFTDLKPEQGITYLILNVTYKNTDSESRMIDQGSVYIQYNGKEYQFDKSETILADGWGILLDQINPLTSKTTNVVYKIPAEIKGPAYYEPGRNSDGRRIFLGEI